MSSINNNSEIKHFNNQDRVVNYIEKQYNAVINAITPLIQAGVAKIIIEKKLNALLKKATADIVTGIETGIKYSWSTSHKRNVAYFEKRLAGYDLPDKVKAALFKPNTGRLEAFIARTDNDLTLSDRVWRHSDQLKNNVNLALDLGIAEGKPTKKIARELRQDLRDPRLMFQKISESRGKIEIDTPDKPG